MTDLRYRVLGRSGLRISEVALGTMNFGLGPDAGWGPDDAGARRIYDSFRAAGGNYVDTANQYADGRSEELVGQFVSGHRDEVVIATKFTNSAPQRGANAGGNHRKNMVQSAEASLRRLGTDFIDLYLLHAWDQLTPIEEVMRAFDDLVRSGKVLHVGVSNSPAWVVAKANTIAELRGWSTFVGVQVEYSLLARTSERDLVPMATDQGMTLLAWSPLKNGLLTGKYEQAVDTTGSRLGTATFQSDLIKDVTRIDDKGRATVREVVALAEEVAATPAQVALAWLLRRQAPVIPIVGASSVEQLESNLASVDVELTDEHMARLDAVSAFDLGYPHDYLAGAMSRSFSSGGMRDRLLT